MIHAAEVLKGKIDATEYDNDIKTKQEEVQKIEDENAGPRKIQAET